MIVTFNITQKDIDTGKRVSVCRCPIALSALRTLKCLKCNVGYGYMFVHYGYGIRGRYSLPEEALRFIKRFDAGLPVRPFTFELDNGIEVTR